MRIFKCGGSVNHLEIKRKNLIICLAFTHSLRSTTISSDRSGGLQVRSLPANLQLNTHRIFFETRHFLFLCYGGILLSSTTRSNEHHK
jgi:hypothetical protein